MGGTASLTGSSAAGGNRVLAWWISACVALLMLPTAWGLSFGGWQADRHGHELIVVLASAYLAWRQRAALAALPIVRHSTPALLLLLLALAWYVRSRANQVLSGEMLSQVLALAAIALYFKGLAGLKLLAIPLAFLVFAVPPTPAVTMGMTAPLKLAVSKLSVSMLSLAGYPVARSGVVITVGQYQLLVAEACAGLQTMFALEAATLYYGQLMNLGHWRRQVAMAIIAVPIGFVANTLRTIVLILITYHFGDEAGRGFLHGFAGLLLFAVALGMAHLASRFIMGTGRRAGGHDGR